MINFYVLEAAAQQQQNPASILTMILPLALMFGLLYFLMIRPQKKKEKALRALIDSMAVGDQCVTTGGIVGKVVNIRDDEVTLQTSAANTLVTFKKAAITNVLKPYSDEV